MKIFFFATPTFSQYQRNVVSSWLSQILAIVVVFYLTPKMINHLGDYKYGIWLLINSAVAYMSLLELGVNISTGRFVNIHIGKNNYIGASEVLSTSTAFYAMMPLIVLPLVWFLGSAVVDSFFSQVTISDDVFIASFLTVTSLFINLSSANLRIKLSSNHRFDVSSVISIVEVSVRASMILYMIYNYEDISLAQVSLATFFSAILVWVLSLILSSVYGENIPILYRRVNRSVFITIFTFSGWVMVCNIGVASINYSDKIIIGYFIDPTNVAYYGIGFMLFTHLGKIFSKLSQVKIPHITQLVGKLEKTELLTELQNLMALTGIITMPAIITFMLFADSFITLWLGQDFTKSALIGQVLAFALIFELSMSGIGAALWAKGIVKVLSIVKISVAVLNIALSVLFIHLFDNGLFGVALATVVIRLTELVVVMPILAKKELGISIVSIAKAHAWLLLFVLSALYLIPLASPYPIFAKGWLSLALFTSVVYIILMAVAFIYMKLTRLNVIRFLDKDQVGV